MYLSDAPVYFVRGNSRRAVYHTVVADELMALGWTKEEGKATDTQEKPKAKEVEQEEIKEVESELEVKSEEPDEPSLDSMTKNELIEYATNNGVVINPYAAKAEILAACVEFSND